MPRVFRVWIGREGRRFKEGRRCGDASAFLFFFFQDSSRLRFSAADLDCVLNTMNKADDGIWALVSFLFVSHRDIPQLTSLTALLRQTSNVLLRDDVDCEAMRQRRQSVRARYPATEREIVHTGLGRDKIRIEGTSSASHRNISPRITEGRSRLTAM